MNLALPDHQEYRDLMRDRCVSDEITLIDHPMYYPLTTPHDEMMHQHTQSSLHMTQCFRTRFTLLPPKDMRPTILMHPPNENMRPTILMNLLMRMTC